MNPRLRRPLAAIRRRARRRIGAVPNEQSPSRVGLALSELVPVLYPRSEDQAGLLAKSRAIVGAEFIAGTHDLRWLLSSLDRQVHPSPVTVRFCDEDIDRIDLDGFSMVIDRADVSVSAVIADRREYEPHVTAAIRAHCRPGMTAVDIGANIGYHTLIFSRTVGPTGRVLAFEASSENCRLVLANAKLNAAENVVLCPVALDRDRGWAYFMNHLGSNAGIVNEDTRAFVEGAGWIVPTFRLDDLIEERVDMMKIDVEGAEGRVVQGALSTVERDRPVLIMEFSIEMLNRVSRMGPEEFLAIFSELRYGINILDRDEPGSVTGYTTPGDFLREWGEDHFRIEDLLLVPR